MADPDDEDDDDAAPTIPNTVPRGTTKDPADRAPKRGATTGLGPDGKAVIHVPGEGTHEAATEAPEAIPTGAPIIRNPDAKA